MKRILVSPHYLYNNSEDDYTIRRDGIDSYGLLLREEFYAVDFAARFRATRSATLSRLMSDSSSSSFTTAV